MADFDFDATFGEDYLHFYLPTLTPERNEADTAEIIDALELAPGKRILDAPCGHGRISNLLAKAGMRVTGLDRSAPFLEVARRDAAALGVEVDYRLGDLADLISSVPEQFDAVVNWFTSFGYHDDHTLRSILAAYRSRLGHGGLLLIETLHHDWFVSHHREAPVVTTTSLGDDEMQDHAVFSPATGRVETRRTIRRNGHIRTWRYFVRLPTSEEWLAWLHGAGFGDVRLTARGGSDLTPDSRRVLVVAQV